MDWATTKTLRFALLNAENLFLLFDDKKQDLSALSHLIQRAKPQPSLALSEQIHTTMEAEWQKSSSSVFHNKPLRKCHHLAQTILHLQPDILMLCEVGGLESLENFNELFLHKTYSVALTEGNSDRNIDVGFLIRKDLQLYFDLASNRHRPINFLYNHERKTAKPGHSHRFSRDVAELKVFTRSLDDPFLMILLTHLKSPRDPDGQDPQGTERRKAELVTLVDVYNEVRAKHPAIPTIVAGDFNGMAGRPNTDLEFKSLYEKTDLVDVLELAQLPPEKRFTYHQVKPNLKVEGRQLDYCFLSPELHPLVSPGKAGVQTYKDELGFEIPPPQTMESKLLMPSDHYPVFFELEKVKIW